MKKGNLARTFILGLATLTSASALALDWDGTYVLGGIGYAGVDKAKFADNSTTNYDGYEFGNPNDLEAGGNFGWRAAVGAWLTDNFAVEFNYFGIANMDDTLSTSQSDDQDDDLAGGSKIHTTGMFFLDLSGVGRFDLLEDFWGFARLGIAWAQVDRKIECQDSRVELCFNSREDEGGMGAAIGIGAQYDFTDMIGVRIETSTVQALNDNDMYAVTGNLVINFGEFL